MREGINRADRLDLIGYLDSMRDQPKPTSQFTLVLAILACALAVVLALLGWFLYAFSRGGAGVTL